MRDVLLLFAFPLAIALIAISVVYIPTAFARPGYDFIYSNCDDYDCVNSFSQDSQGTITSVDKKMDANGFYTKKATLRYYDMSEGSSHAIGLAEANNYQLSNSNKAPDGYTFAAHRNSGFLFGDFNQHYYAEKGFKKKQLTLNTADTNYSQNTPFIGWVLHGK